MNEGDLIPIPQAAVELDVDVKRLRGRVWRNDLEDPIGDIERDLVVVDWRLRKAAESLRAIP